MDYPVTLERDDTGTILVSFPDLPEAHTFGEDESDALERAKDALATSSMPTSRTGETFRRRRLWSRVIVSRCRHWSRPRFACMRPCGPRR